MLYPSLTMIFGFCAFCGSAWAAWRLCKTPRLYLGLARSFAALAAALLLAGLVLPRSITSGWPIAAEMHTSSPNGSWNTSTVSLGWEMPALLALLALLFAWLTRLQDAKQAAHYPRVARWSAPALALPLIATEPLVFGAPYLFGLIPFEFAQPAYKIAGIFGAGLLLAASLALMLMLAQFIFSLIRALSGQRSAA